MPATDITDAQSDYLLLADISGYMAFLSDSELEHARDTLTDLLGLLIDHAKPPLVLSKLEGDAVFSYTGGQKSFKDGQILVELMVVNNICQCAACANVSKLDLRALATTAPSLSRPWWVGRTRGDRGDSRPPLDEVPREGEDRDHGPYALNGFRPHETIGRQQPLDRYLTTPKPIKPTHPKSEQES